MSGPGRGYNIDPFFKLQNSLTQIYTEDTPTVKLEGYGTKSRPLKAHVLGGVSSGGGSTPITDYVSVLGSYANPSWITSLAWNKISGAPTIPTLTSQLTNDSAFITLADIPSSGVGEDELLTMTALRNTPDAQNTSYYIIDNNKEGIFHYDGSDTTTADDGIMTIVNTATNKRYKRKLINGLVNVLWWGADNTGATDTSAAQQAMWNFVKASPDKVNKVLYPSGRYKTNTAVVLPDDINSVSAFGRINVDGYGATIFTDQAIKIWTRIPASQTDADNTYISNYVATVKGFTFEGNNTTNQYGAEIDAIYSWNFEDLTFASCDVGFMTRFALNCYFRSIRFQSCKSDNFVGTFGNWTGATESNSAFNANTIENVRVYGASGALTHYKALGGNGNFVRNYVSEGFSPVHNFYIDYSGATPVKQNFFENIWIESNGGTVTQGTAFRIRNVGLTQIRGVHMDYDDILFDSTNSAAGMIWFDSIHYLGALPTVAFNTGTASVILGYKIKFTNIGNSDNFRTKLYSTASWANGVVPVEVMYEYVGESGSGAHGIASGGEIHLRPGNSSSSKVAVTFGKHYVDSAAGSEQVRFRYDASNYFMSSTTSQGRTILNTVGTVPYWTYQISGVDKLTLTNTDASFATNIYPATDSNKSLGLTGAKWSKVWAVDAEFTGTIVNTALTNSIAAKVTANANITGATKTKVTYDAKGLVTAGADATTTDIAEGSNLYFTDERVQDAMNTALVHGSHSGITVAYNDASNRFEFTVAGAGSGDVVGPASATANGVVRYNGTTGKAIKDSLATLSDTGLLTCVGVTSTGKIDVTLVTEQARFGFDAGSYMTITVADGSGTTFDLAESSNFTFNKPIIVGNIQTNATSTNANLAVWSTTTVATSVASINIGSGPNTSARAWMRGSSAPTIAPGDNYSSFVIGAMTVTESSTAATVYPLFTQMTIHGLAVTNHANSSLTDYATLHIKGVVSGVTPTGRNLGLWVQDGEVELSEYGGAGNRMLAVDNAGKLYTAALPTSGTGDVVGPASATDNAVVRYDSTTGKLVQNSTVTISDTGALAGVTTINTFNLEGYVVLGTDRTTGLAGVWSDITGLSFAADAGGIYHFKAFLSFDGTATSGGVKFGVSGPALTRINYRTQHTNAANNDWFNGGMDAYDEGVTSNTILSTTNNTAIMEGIITVSGSGNVVLRFSSEVDNGITVKAFRSVLIYRKIG
jgi:hypothetical protein